jgi:5-methylcytosine-specific restriction protein B
MYLLEYRNKQMVLQGGGAFQLPENLYIIGTMNSADRSVRGLDLALRRRFDFFNIEPDGKVISNYYDSGNGPNCEGITSDQLVSFFNKLNTQISEDGQTSDLAIGHSYFMKKKMTKSVLERIWNQQLHPLIREYFIGNPDVIANYSFSKFFDS